MEVRSNAMIRFFKKYNLQNLDKLYANIMINRSLKERLEYCISLLHRVESDLKGCNQTKIKKHRLKILKKAAVQEIALLQKLIKPKL